MAGDVEAGKAFVRLSIKEDLRALRNISRKLKTWGAGLSVVGAGISAMGASVIGAVAAMANSFTSAGDQVDKMSARLGTSAEFIGRIGHAAALGGTDLETMEKGVRKLQQTAYDATNGMKTAADSFSRLGVDVRDTNGELKPTEQLFMDTVSALSEMDNASEKAAVAMDVFGRAGTMLLPMLSQGKDGLIAAMKEADKLGVVLSKEDAAAAAALNDAMYRMKATMKGVFLQIGSAVAPALTEMAEKIAVAISHVTKFVRENKQLIVTVVKLAGIAIAVGAIIGTIGMAMMGLGVIVGGIASLISVALNPVTWIVAAIGTLVAVVVVWATVAAVAFAKFTKTGQRMWARTRVALQSIADKVREVFGGIVDAIRAGQIELAWEILWTGIKFYFLSAIKEIVTQWGKFVQNMLTDMQTIAQLVGRYSGLGLWFDTDKWIADAMTKLKASAAGLQQYLTPDTAELEKMRDKLNKLILDARAAAAKAEHKARYPDPTGKQPAPMPSAPLSVTSAGTFSAAAARIMFQAQSDDYASRTATATEEIAKRFRTMPKVRFVFEG